MSNVKNFFHEVIKSKIPTRYLRALLSRLVFTRFIYWIINYQYIKLFNKCTFTPKNKTLSILSELQNKGILISDLEEFGLGHLLPLLQNRFKNLSTRGTGSNTRSTEFNNVIDLNGDLSNELLSEILCNKDINFIVHNYFQQIARLGYKEEVISYPSYSKRSNARLWHRDAADIKILKLFIYLSDVSLESGPFEYICNTHYLGTHSNLNSIKSVGISKLNKGELRLEGLVESRSELNSQIVTAVGKAGTIIFCDTSGIHRGGHCLNSPRELISFAYYSNSAYLSLPAFVVSDKSFFKSKMMKAVLGL